MDDANAEEQLRKDLIQAHADFENAKSEFEKATAGALRANLDPLVGAEKLLDATRTYTAAVNRYAETVKKLGDFMSRNRG